MKIPKPLIYISIILSLAFFLTGSVLAEKPDSLGGITQLVKQLQETISKISTRLDNIQLLPGPKGDKGDQGPVGPSGNSFIQDLSLLTQDESGYVTVNHNLNTEHPFVELYNGNIHIPNEQNDTWDGTETNAWVIILDKNNLKINYGFLSNHIGSNATSIYAVIGSGGPKGDPGKNGISGAGDIAFINVENERRAALKTDGTVWIWSKEQGWKQFSEGGSKYNVPVSPSKIVQWELTSFLDSEGNIWQLNKSRWENTGHP